MKKEIIIAVLATVLVVFGILIVIGLVNQKEDIVSVPLTEDTLNNFKTGFMNECVKDDSTSYETCNCAYNELLKEYGSEGLIGLSVEYLQTQELPTRAINAVVKCIK